MSSLNFDFSPWAIDLFCKDTQHFTLKPKLFFHDKSIKQVGLL